MSIAIREVETARDRRAFVRFPWSIYRDDPLWVPPLLIDVATRLNRRKNPFFLHSDAQLFLAWRGGRVVGRIAAIENRRHRQIHGDDVGFFGWFESERDPEVASALFARAESWLLERGCDAMRGPASFSLNDECGLLVEGFHRPPALMTPWNPPWYAELVEGCGFEKVMDLHSFRMPVDDFDVERIGRFAELIGRRENVTIRNFDRRDFRREVERVMAIYNQAWEDNWGFVPMTDAELEHMAKALKPLLEPRLVAFAEVDGEPIGFSLVVPDVNPLIKRIDGRLLPFGFWTLMRGVRRTPGIRLMAMGVVRAFHRKGIDSLLYLDAFRNSKKTNKVQSEIGWVLETNPVMINTIEKIGGIRDRTHRLYQRGIPRDGKSDASS